MMEHSHSWEGMSMDQLLDLSISLNIPPSSSPPEVIATIDIRCDQLGLFHTGGVLTNPFKKDELELLHWYLEEYWKWPYEQFLKRGRYVEDLLADLGERLYQALFGSLQARDIAQAWRLSPATLRQISIKSSVPTALSLPWELLHDEQGFLVLRTRPPVSLVRCLPLSQVAALPTRFEPPLRILVVTARPEGTGFVDPRSIARELVDEVQEQIEAGAIALEFLRPPTRSSLRTRLGDMTLPPVHVLHFDGHGTFESDLALQNELRMSGGGQGMLAFENEDGKLDLVKAEEVAQVLQHSGVRLAVLTACQSAMGSSDDAFSSVASRLIKGGVDAVVAMSASVLVVSATLYVEAFYHGLAMGIPASMAHERARQALYDNPSRHLSRRHRDEEGKPVELRDWWLPHFYQQRPLLLQATKRVQRRNKPQDTSLSSRLSDGMPAEPRYGFSGRARELLHIERRLVQEKVVVVHGFGGVGKTALVREAADWLTRTKMYEGACFISFEYGGDASVLLSTLGHYLGIYDSQYNPNDWAKALKQLKPTLKKRHILVIADNLESILPGGEAPLDAAVRTQLWNVLLELAAMSAGVLLTSRNTGFGDGRLTPGKQVAYLSLSGLSPEAAYALACRLLDNLGIDRKDAPYVEMRELLAQLDHHPLAIQLVLPILRELPLSKIRSDLTALLPRFQDNNVEGRNKSLLFSLDYSLKRLSEEQQAVLPRLALFEGGTMEQVLLLVTEIPEIEWAKLRPALEQAALLTVEQIPGFTVPFLRFHPVLALYLRSQVGADDANLRERYIRVYCEVAIYLNQQDISNAPGVRAVLPRDLPNLRRAVELLLETGRVNEASHTAALVADFLRLLGMERESNELRRRVVEALTTTGAQKDKVLTNDEFWHERSLGDDEMSRGNLQVAFTRFAALLSRIEVQPEGDPLGRGSYEHCLVLQSLAECLIDGEQPTFAEGRLREAQSVIEALIKQYPENQAYIRERGTLLANQGDVLLLQGQYSQAQKMYGEALAIAKQQKDLRAQAVALAKLGRLALKQWDYTEAWSHYTTALELFHTLNEPGGEAMAWYQLGRVAQEQRKWAEADRCFREGLALFERQGDIVNTAKTYGELASVAMEAGHLTEAQGWFRRALERGEQVHPDSHSHAVILSGFARLLVDEVRADHAPIVSLVEAKDCAQRALTIMEPLDASAGTWMPLSALADIADLEGKPEAARDYRRRERETFAAFTGHRFHLDGDVYETLFAAAAAAAKGDMQARMRAEAILQVMELGVTGQRISAAIQRIWAGERDWHALSETFTLNEAEALMVLRVLETIAEPMKVQNRILEETLMTLPAALHEALERGDSAAFEQVFEALSLQEQQEIAEALQTLQQSQAQPEQVIASLPLTIQEALKQEDEAVFEQAFEALSPEEQQRVEEVMEYLQSLDNDAEEELDTLDETYNIQELDPLLQAIAAAAGDTTQRNGIDGLLTTLEITGRPLGSIRKTVQRIWAGERNEATLTLGLNELDTAVIHRVLEILAGG
jgi:tetratricopeptide (TPR) repeat protein